MSPTVTFFQIKINQWGINYTCRHNISCEIYFCINLPHRRLGKKWLGEAMKISKEIRADIQTRAFRRVAEFQIRLTFWENLSHRPKGWNWSEIKAKYLYFKFDWVVRSKIGSVIYKKGEIPLSLPKRELWNTNFKTIFLQFKNIIFSFFFFIL